MSIPNTIREYRVKNNNGFDGLTLAEVSLPKTRATEVLVKIHAVSLQFRDLIVAKGVYPMTTRKNVVPGSDMAGEIVVVGEDVKGWKTGDRVCANFALDHIHGDVTPAIQLTSLGAAIDGVLTEYRNIPAHSLVRIPEHLSYEEGSTLPCAAVTAYNALMGPTPLKGGDTVLVQGTGGVSIFALQFAAASGATVIVTSSSDNKLNIASKLGAHHLINYRKTPNWEEEVLKLTNGRGVDHIIEVGGSGTIAKSMKSVRTAGWIHTIGFVAENGEGADIIVQAIIKGFILRGIQIGSVSQFEDMNRLITTTKLRPVVDKVFPFENLKEAYEYLDSQAHVGKVVVKVSKD